ncbi:hypothetical protein [Flectobacillus sp. BAB-3569]|uniref:hypothetical protein n=1 Tax=Flectobacillus sp. BAB-3569 TaxID=1509483 RepID=UPI000BA4E225|nr:hypothetical protein [Flectobacillus sp. BAB-3569]PAC30622.1 hypothetical protein BWI92_11340 [Flectobacillus sp. BAB-3569]
MRKERLIFFTNIPTPYQLDLFSSLSKIVHLTVVYSAKSENNRSWVLSDHKDYKSIYLDNNFFARIVQNKFVDFHYAGDLKKVLNNLKSDGQFDYAIVGGSYWNPNGVRQLYWARKNCRKVAYFSEPLYDTNSIIKKILSGCSLKT